MTEYRPGVCNIGRAERRKRYVLGTSAFAAAIIGVWRNGIATPLEAVGILVLLFIGFEGIYQGRTGFCAAFGHAGIYDVSENGKEPDQVRDPKARRKDQRRALRMHVFATGAAIIAMAILFAITY